MKTMASCPIHERETRIRVERDNLEGGLVQIVEEYSPGDRVRTRPEKIGGVLLTMSEAEFVYHALGEILSAHLWPTGLQGASRTLMLYPSRTRICPFDPKPEDIHIEDIAHSLACMTRCNGALPEPYSIAQHCLVVSGFCPEQPLWALLHEVAEALSGMGDVCGPTKRHPTIRGPVKELERRIERAAAVRFGFPEDFASAPCVKRADNLAFAWEDRDMRGGTDDEAWVVDLRPELPAQRLVPMGWREAEAAFLARFALLTGTVPVWRPRESPSAERRQGAAESLRRDIASLEGRSDVMATRMRLNLNDLIGNLGS